MLNFIFTTCTTICPVLAASFYQVQHELGEESKNVKMISISIDPEYDTPEKLRSYAERFNAGPQWQFLTGETDDIIAVEKAFDAFRGAKMNHEPLTFIRAKEDGSWVRITGIASAKEILSEYRNLVLR
jgi:protein SCO1/2